VLWSEGIERIDTLVVSHADADHFNAVPELLDRFRVGRILVPDALPRNASAGVAELMEAAARRGVAVSTAGAGDSFAIDPLCRVHVQHPAREVPAEAVASDNQSSLVLAVEAAGRRLLLTGDLEGEALRRYLAEGPGPCDVLVAPHHGSHTSLPPDIAAVTRPRFVVASGRRGRRWPEVRDTYRAAAGGAAQVLLTGNEGALAVWLTADQVDVTRYAAGRWQPVAVPDAAPPGAPAEPGERQSPAVAVELVRSEPAASRKSWLATYPPSSSSTPLVKP